MMRENKEWDRGEFMKALWANSPKRRERQKNKMTKQRALWASNPVMRKRIYKSRNRSRKISEAVKRYAANPSNKKELSARWSPERRRKQSEIMKKVRASYYSVPANVKKWHKINSHANGMAGKKKIGIKRPECSHVAWNKGLTKETSPLVARLSKQHSRPRSEQARKNIAAAAANRKIKNPEWYKKICRINRKNAKARKGVPRSVETMRKIMNYRKPTSIERQFITLIKKHNLPYKYVGDGNFWIGDMNPDFIHTDKKERKVIELYGDYWHRNHNPQDRIDRFAKSRFSCAVIWEREFKQPGWEQKVMSLAGVTA